MIACPAVPCLATRERSKRPNRLPRRTTLVPTVIGIAVAAIIAGVALWLDNRPYRPGRIWRIPYRAIGFLAIVAACVLAGHLVTILTGEPFRGRMG